MNGVVTGSVWTAAVGLPRCRVAAVIPAFNEDRLIGSVVLKAREYAHDVIVVDDGSADATAAVARAAGAQVLAHPQNYGKGAAMNTGLRFAQRLGPAAVVVLDGDGQHRPSEIPLLAAAVLRCIQCDDGCGWYKNHLENGRLKALWGLNGPGHQPDEKPDIVVGSRYLDERSEVPAHRIWGHWAFNLLTRGMTGVGTTDSQSGYRAFSKRALEVVRFQSNGFSVESEMQFIAHEHGLKLVDVPVEIAYHEKPKRNVLQHGMMVLGGLLRLMGQFRPLLYFGLPGAISMFVGVSWGFWVVDIFRRTGELAVGYAMLSVLFCVAGLVSFSTGVILHSVRGLLTDFLRTNGK